MTTWAAAVITGALSLGAPHAMAPPYIPIGQCKSHVISLCDYLTLFPGFVSRRVAISRPRRQSGSPSGPSLVQILLSLAPFVPPICALECCKVTARLGLGRTTPACPFWPYSPLCAFWAMGKNTKPTDPCPIPLQFYGHFVYVCGSHSPPKNFGLGPFSAWLRPFSRFFVK